MILSNLFINRFNLAHYAIPKEPFLNDAHDPVIHNPLLVEKHILGLALDHPSDVLHQLLAGPVAALLDPAQNLDTFAFFQRLAEEIADRIEIVGGENDALRLKAGFKGVTVIKAVEE